MATVVQLTRTAIDSAREDEFNEWYNTIHVPNLLSFRGAVSAHRYRLLLGEEQYQYLAMYEFADEQTYQRWVDSDHRARMYHEYVTKFGPIKDSQDRRSAWSQIWPG